MILQSLAQFRAGNQSAFSDIYDASYDTVYRFVYHRTLDTVLTEDIISDIYMKVLRNISTLRATSEWEFFSWILRIAYTTLIDTVRREKPTDSLEDMMHEPGYEKNHAADIDNQSKLEEVLNFMNTLSERDQLILSMRVWDELSYEEIAAITGESVANCKQIVSRSLAKISANVSYLFIFSVLLPILLSFSVGESLFVIARHEAIHENT